MSVRINSAAISGLDALRIEVETDTFVGLHAFNIVGLPDKSVEESRDRLDSAIRNSGFINPKAKNLRVVVNLAPANIKKEGSLLDLPIALGYLAATSQLKFDTSRSLVVGELSLDGSIRFVHGILPIALLAKKLNFEEIIVPKDNAAEAALVKDLKVIGVPSLKELAGYFRGNFNIEAQPFSGWQTSATASEFDFAYIKGQETAKQALTIAAAGGHNLLLYGPPGSGKTILARALHGILSEMSYDESLDVTKIYSVAGLTAARAFVSARPFRNPHHTTSAVAIIGGGHFPRPGEISLAHHGVLFLDELPEFPRSVLEALRQPLEDGQVTVSRANGSSQFPARFMLVGAMNPCPCGYFGSEQQACLCPPGAVAKYKKKISGPLLDRIDLQVFVPQETFANMSQAKMAESSENVRKKIEKARLFQAERLRRLGINCNAQVSFKDIESVCLLSPTAKVLLEKFIDKERVSGRGYHRVLKVARTVADLSESQVIEDFHLSEALTFRLSSISNFV